LPYSKSSGFPRLNIGNITLEKNNINVKASLSVKNSQLNYLKYQDTAMKSYAKVYFIISHPKHIGDPRIIESRILSNSQKRFQNLAIFMGMRGQNLPFWMRNLKKAFYYNTVSVAQIMETKGNITSSENYRGSDYIDVNFEVNIPILEELYTTPGRDGVMLHAFMQFDVESMLDNGFIEQLPLQTSGFFTGGNLVSKKILESTSLGLMPPTTTQGLSLASTGAPYYGAFVASDQGYVSVPKSEALVVVSSPEKSISPDYFVEKAALPSGNRSKEETSRHLQYSYSKPLLDFSMADLMIEGNTQVFYSEGYVQQTKNVLALRQISSPQASYITNAVHSVSTNPTSCYKIRFDLNWEKIIKDKTKYGFLLDLVKRNPTINNLITVPGITQTRFDVDNVLRNYFIKELSVKRTRIDKLKQTANSVGTKTKLEKSDEKVQLINIQNFSFDLEYQQASYSIQTTQNRQKVKTIEVKDMGLYSRPHGGEYSYTVSLVIEDRTALYFRSLLTQMHQNLDSLSKRLYQISIDPLAKNMLLNKDKVMESSIHSSANGTTGLLIDIYLLLLLWSGKEFTRSQLIKTRNQILTMVDSESGGTISGLYKFKDMCDTLAYQVEKMFETSGLGDLDTNIKPQNLSKESKLLSYEFKIPGTTTSISDGQVMVSYSQEQGSQQTSLPGFIPDTFLFKQGTQNVTVTSRSEVLSLTNPSLRENRLLLLESMLKNTEHPRDILRKMRLPDYEIELENTFGLSGTTVVIPKQSEAPQVSNKADRIQSKSAEADSPSSLSSNMKSSISASIVAKTGNSKIKEQLASSQPARYQNPEIIRGVMKILSFVNTGLAASSSNVDIAKDLQEQVFLMRSGLVTIGIPSTSGEMEFKPLTQEALSSIVGEDIVVKIQDPSSRSPKEDYRLVDNVFELKKQTLKNLLTQNR